MTFDGLELKDYIVKALLDLNFKNFSDVQKEVFSNFNKGKNLLVRSKTGSGKTHSFLIPIFNTLDEDLEEVQAIIVSPTKELAAQTFKFCQQIASFSDKKINIKLYSSGQDKLKDIEAIKSHQPQIVISTPGRLKDLAIDENVLKIYTAKIYVIDEVDMTLDNGFKDEIDSVSSVLENAYKMFFSATIAEGVLPFIKKYLDNPLYIDLKNDKSLAINHYWLPVKHKTKLELLDSLISIINPYLCVIFCNKKETVNEVYAHLASQKLEVGMIQGGMDKRSRKQFLKQSDRLKFQYIVASDLAARGIDIDGVSHIINYDIPYNFEFYLHRSGRTGRMNYSGDVYSFYTELDNEYLDNLAKNGIEPIYKDIRQNEIVDYKGRDSRKQRIKPKTEIYKIAKKHVAKPKKVTPGYKKKMKKKVDEIASRLYAKKDYQEKKNLSKRK